MQSLITFLGNHVALTTATFIVFVLVMTIEWIRTKRNIFGLSPQAITRLINQENAIIIDTREKEVFQKGHIINAQSLNPDTLKNEPKKLTKFRNKPLIIVAHHQHEAQKITASLKKSGYNAFFLSGGINAWIEAQMPLIKD